MRHFRGKADAIQSLHMPKTVQSFDQFLVPSANISKVYRTFKHLAHSSVTIKQKFRLHMERRPLIFQKIKSRNCKYRGFSTLILERKLH